MREWIPVPGTSKARLVSTALERFGARGYEAVGVSELATTAGVTTGSLYHHFGSKLGLYEVVREEAERRVLDRMEGAAAARAGERPRPLPGRPAGRVRPPGHPGLARLLASGTRGGGRPVESFLDRLTGRAGRRSAASWPPPGGRAGRPGRASRSTGSRRPVGIADRRPRTASLPVHSSTHRRISGRRLASTPAVRSHVVLTGRVPLAGTGVRPSKPRPPDPTPISTKDRSGRLAPRDAPSIYLDVLRTPFVPALLGGGGRMPTAMRAGHRAAGPEGGGPTGRRWSPGPTRSPCPDLAAAGAAVDRRQTRVLVGCA